MNDEERRRTMDFILEQQAQFTIDNQEIRRRHEQAEKRFDRLERVVKLVTRAGLRERRDFRERYSALLDAQIKTEEMMQHNTQAIEALSEKDFDNSENIRTLTKQNLQNSENIKTLTNENLHNSENIRAVSNEIRELAKIVATITRDQKGNRPGK